jgi:phenylacetate-coenzyme A ligase PaaK-like adenylate-forming protein
MYEQFQWEDSAVIAAYQFRALCKLLNYAYGAVRFYRDSFDAIGLHPEDIKSLNDLSELPYLEKEDLATNYAALVAGPKKLLASRKTTGGSTGQAVTVLKNVDALARERAATWRGYRWAGVDICDPQARFWGIPLRSSQRLAATIIDLVANRKRLSAFGVDDQVLQKYYQKIWQFKPTYFYGYVSIITEFATFVKQNSYAVPPTLRAVITTSEVLDDANRRQIEEVFQCKVHDEYGCGEVGSIAHECERGGMHIMAENLVVETLAEPNVMGKAGEIVVTDLFNYAMPLIRYKLKDYVTLSDHHCSCGRGLPTIYKVYGRAYDIIVDKGGKKYHPEILMYIFEDMKKKYGTIKQFQVIQKTLTTLEVRVVPDKRYDAESERAIKSAIHDKVSDSFNVFVSYKKEIERERSGKIRLIKSELQRHD